MTMTVTGPPPPQGVPRSADQVTPHPAPGVGEADRPPRRLPDGAPDHERRPRARRSAGGPAAGARSPASWVPTSCITRCRQVVIPVTVPPLCCLGLVLEGAT